MDRARGNAGRAEKRSCLRHRTLHAEPPVDRVCAYSIPGLQILSELSGSRIALRSLQARN